MGPDMTFLVCQSLSKIISKPKIIDIDLQFRLVPGTRKKDFASALTLQVTKNSKNQHIFTGLVLSVGFQCLLV